MLQFGGHSAAAGFSIDAHRIDELRERLTEYCKKIVTAEEYIPVVTIDAELPVDDIDVDIIDRVSGLEPYGMGNSTPVFCCNGSYGTRYYAHGTVKKIIVR